MMMIICNKNMKKMKRLFLKEVNCQNIDSSVTISIINDWYWISAGWLACLLV